MLNWIFQGKINLWRGLKALKFIAFLIITAASLIIIKNEAIRQFYPSFDDKNTANTPSNIAEEKFTKLVLRVAYPVATKETAGKENLTQKAQAGLKSYPYDFFYFDTNGTVSAGDVSVADKESLPVIEIRISKYNPIKSGMAVMTKEEVDYVKGIYETVNKSTSNLEISHIIYNPSAKEELAVVAKEGWIMYLNTNLSIDAQIKKLELALADKIKENRKNLLYVDLRVNDSVYYKFKE